MITIKSPAEIKIMAEGGKILADVLQKTLAKVSPGISTRQLDDYADTLISAAGGKPSFKMEKGYHFATCMNVNDMVVHGLPTDYQLQTGDILGVDVGIYHKGFHTDASWTIEVESKKLIKFLKTGEEALGLAIKQCIPGNHIGDISQAIQATIEGSGYGCVKQLVGHGVGQALHEDPEIPCYLRGRVENTPLIKAGMVFAIEIIYNLGNPQVVYGSDDGWTIVTRDGLPSGLFEHTVAVTPKGPLILTLA